MVTKSFSGSAEKVCCTISPSFDLMLTTRVKLPFWTRNAGKRRNNSQKCVIAIREKSRKHWWQKSGTSSIFLPLSTGIPLSCNCRNTNLEIIQSDGRFIVQQEKLTNSDKVEIRWDFMLIMETGKFTLYLGDCRIICKGWHTCAWFY